MLSLLLTAALLTASQDPKPAPPPDPERVEAVVAELKSSFARKDTAPKLEAVAAAEQLLHKDVIVALAKGLKEEHEVQAAVIEALRWMDHPESLSQLHSAYKKNKGLADDAELFPALLKAIGQHGNKDSIKVLADNPFKTTGRNAIRARILGLGKIRTRDSFDEVIALMQKVGRKKSVPYMDDFRMALMHLTGVDKGKSNEAWMRWWNDNKRSFKLPSKEPVLPKAQARFWSRYWGLEYEMDRNKEREDRGDDGETD
jgi:hypothetical protein